MSVDLISLDSCNLAYGNAKILSNISLSIAKGDFVCLCGPNGAGKSTLMRAMVENVPAKKSKERSRLVSFLPQNESALWSLSVFDTVLAGRYCHTGILGNYSVSDEDVVNGVLEEFNLTYLKEKSIHEISGGEFQKVRLARSFAQNSDFILLDEPLSSLDFVVSEELMNLLKEKAQAYQKGILISIHDINMAARFADRMVLLGKYDAKTETQKLICGTVKEVMTDENLSEIYKTQVKVFAHPETGIPQI